MKVSELFQRSVLGAEVDDSLADVAARLQFHEVGALAVFATRSLIGIITERDLVRAMAEGADLEHTAASEYMTPGAVTINADSEISEAASIMLDKGTRHLPVMERGKVVGMLSARDLLTIVAGGK